MTTFLLIRHGAHLLGGDRLAGRKPGVFLSPLGRDQAVKMASRVAPVGVAAVYASPMERTQETAALLAENVGVTVRTSDALQEVDFGEWTGAELTELRGMNPWKRWNMFRSGARTQGGESMVEVQARVVGTMLRLGEEHGDEVVALVTHGDVIRAALAYFMGVPLDLFQRIEVSLASVSVVRVAEFGPWVLCVNSTGDLVMG